MLSVTAQLFSVLESAPPSVAVAKSSVIRLVVHERAIVQRAVFQRRLNRVKTKGVGPGRFDPFETAKIRAPTWLPDRVQLFSVLPFAPPPMLDAEIAGERAIGQRAAISAAAQRRHVAGNQTGIHGAVDAPPARARNLAVISRIVGQRAADECGIERPAAEVAGVRGPGAVRQSAVGRAAAVKTEIARDEAVAQRTIPWRRRPWRQCCW